MPNNETVPAPVPTPEQAEAIDKMRAFHENPDEESECFLMSGFAGTGKTFSITRFVRQLPKKDKVA